MTEKKAFWLWVMALTILKIVLVSRNEIVAIPYDSIQYVRHAASDVFQIGPAPGYPFWLVGTRLTGIPQRVVIELFFLLSSLGLSVAIRKYSDGTAGTAIFGMLLITPATFFMFDSALSDGFYACLSLIALTFSCLVIFSARLRNKYLASTLLGLVLGCMALTRNEDPLLVLWGMLVLLAVLLRGRDAFGSQRVVSILRNVAALGFLMFLAAGVLVQATNFIHYKSSGVYARSVAGLPGHMELLDNLAGIDAHESNIRFVPITAKARRLAYEASPTLRKVQSRIEDLENPYQVVSRANGMPEGEIGAGWTWHVFNHAILESLHTNDASRWEKEYRSINSELNAAFDTGKLKKRFILHSFMTAPLRDVVLHLPSAIWSVFKKSFRAHQYTEDLGHEEGLFDSVALRRTALVTGSYSYSLQGWAFVDQSGRRIKSIELIREDGEAVGNVIRMERQDVEEIYASLNGWRPDVMGFRAETKSKAKKTLILSYTLDDGSKVTQPFPLASSGVMTLSSAGSAHVMQGMDYTVLDYQEGQGWRQFLQKYLVDIVNQPNTSLVFASILLSTVFLVFCSCRASDPSSYRVYTFLYLIGALVFFRVAFYGLLESEAWVVEVRYMMSANLMLMVVFGLLVALTVGQLRRTLHRYAKTT